MKEYFLFFVDIARVLLYNKFCIVIMLFCTEKRII